MQLQALGRTTKQWKHAKTWIANCSTYHPHAWYQQDCFIFSQRMRSHPPAAACMWISAWRPPGGTALTIHRWRCVAVTSVRTRLRARRSAVRSRVAHGLPPVTPRLKVHHVVTQSTFTSTFVAPGCNLGWHTAFGRSLTCTRTLPVIFATAGALCADNHGAAAAP